VQSFEKPVLASRLIYEVMEASIKRCFVDMSNTMLHKSSCISSAEVIIKMENLNRKLANLFSHLYTESLTDINAKFIKSTDCDRLI